MPGYTRNEIMTALFNKVANSDSLLDPTQRFKTKVRGWKSWTQGNRDVEWPAIYMVEGKQEYTPDSGRLGHPPIRTFFVDFWIYVDTKNQNNPASFPGGPAAATAPYLDAIDTVLAPTLGLGLGVNNLGGLVSSCWIDGEVINIPGYNDGLGLLVVPVKIVGP